MGAWQGSSCSDLDRGSSYVAPDIDVQLSSEISGALRSLKVLVVCPMHCMSELLYLLSLGLPWPSA